MLAYADVAECLPAFLQVTDIAGLVKGAAEGAGLGNAFLSHIQVFFSVFLFLFFRWRVPVEYFFAVFFPKGNAFLLHIQACLKALLRLG
jgi:hypothetical protein